VDTDASGVIGDAPRLQQVVSNLLSNAIKFTARGGRIDVVLDRLDGVGQITVRDNGQGIAPEFLEHVFDRFRQGDSSATRRHGGLGLGLGIVKHLVEAHGGTVSAASEGLGHGAAFTARLPLHLETTPGVHRSGERPPQPTPDLSAVRALVVDDDADAADLLRFALERCDAHVLAVASAMDALQAIDTKPFDVMLADIGMPDVDGHDLIRAVRAREAQVRSTPMAAVAITAHAGPGDRDRALAAGFDWHLTKPVDPGEVIAVVARMTSRLQDLRKSESA
jgi:CheY-like chemotaxis protein